MTSVFIVDSHEPIRKALAQRLGHVPGIRVVGSAGGGRLALDQIAAARPDVILLELKSEGGSGIDVLRAIRARHPPARIIVLTSYLDDFERELALQAGAQYYLLKDIDSQRLAAFVLGHEPATG